VLAIWLGLGSALAQELYRDPNKSEVLLAGAKVDGNVELTGTAFEDKLNASQLQVGGDLSSWSSTRRSTARTRSRLSPAFRIPWMASASPIVCSTVIRGLSDE
jgi:hypothetical protein